MRPSTSFALLLLALSVVVLSLAVHGRQRSQGEMDLYARRASLVAGLGLSDLCLATEARYTRHPALSDEIAPFMDHPGALEHFPSGLFWAPR